MLVKARYPEKFSIGLINGSGSLGLLFPPSLPVILYGIYSPNGHQHALRRGIRARPDDGDNGVRLGRLAGVRHGAERARFSFSEARKAIWDAKWEIAVPFIVLIGLFGGFGTLVEAGAITVSLRLSSWSAWYPPTFRSAAISPA
jgi:C4-dicarboxylate transporter DctM subunit